MKFDVTFSGSSSDGTCPYSQFFALQQPKQDHPDETSCDGANYEETFVIEDSPSSTSTLLGSIDRYSSGEINFGTSGGVETNGDINGDESSSWRERNIRLLVIREIRLDKIHPGYLYKISVNNLEPLPAKKDAPDWTVCLEVPFVQDGVIKIDVSERATKVMHT